MRFDKCYRIIHDVTIHQVLGGHGGHKDLRHSMYLLKQLLI